MALDGIFLNLLKEEIEESALGSRVEKVYQPAKNELVLSLRSRTAVKNGVYPKSADSEVVQHNKTIRTETRCEFKLLLSCSGNKSVRIKNARTAFLKK